MTANTLPDLERPAPDRPGRRRASNGRVLAVVLPVAGTLAAVALWWLAVVAFEIQPYLVPTPPEVLRVFAEMPGDLFVEARVTLWETVAGYGISVVGGVLIGALIAGSRTVERAVYPMLVALNAAPKVAIVPLLIVWFGFDSAPKIVMAVLFCFFPITLATAAGLSSTPADLVELTRSLDASRVQTFVKIRFPAALPQIFVGLKVALPLALVGAVVGELFASDAGLGYLISSSGGSGNTALAFACVALLSLMSIVLFYALVAIERVTLPWVRGTTG
ncbi:ABC transporter permease [Asanoa ishikariensis]|uniref:NitT/TauT family transport system permease protein n=1 Tax=Asanoa ishikariensis TaxID=137265 RepID=A0A1H3MYL8_9ACTN|nr:ABC transporter permease [Asanoa ishikariensis]GIF68962.1 ABC transporter permease [Asanoa ishikariensis]SDY81787.1 NitT/TauT family transport system permease protein [Asanoa ishikariensis]